MSGWLLFLMVFMLAAFALAYSIYCLFNRDPSDQVLAYILLPPGLAGAVILPGMYRRLRRP